MYLQLSSLNVYFWATWFVPLRRLTLKFLTAWICTFERPLPHVGYLLMSSLNVYFLSGLCTFELSDFVHLSGLTMNIWSTWLWTFERPDYVPLSGLHVYLWAAWSDVLLVVVCPWWLTSYSQTWTLLMSLSHSWLARQLMSHVTSGVPPPPPLIILILLINKIWLCSNTNIYIRYEDHAFIFIYRIDLLSLEIVFPLPGSVRNRRSWNYSPTQRLW